MKMALVASVLLVSVASALPSTASAQSNDATPPRAGQQVDPTEGGVPLPEGYVIGPEDVLAVVFWQEEGLSSEVIVRPDGKISLPLLNDVQAAGYTPEQLAAHVGKLAEKFVAEPVPTIIVKQINSRKVFVLGAVGKQGPVSLNTDMTVLQLISLVGGLQEYANRKGIVIVRKENGVEKRMKFNYNDVVRGRRLEQNVLLQPGDTILVFD